MYWDWTQAIYAKAIGFQMKLMMGEAMCCFHHFMPTLSREVFSLLRVITCGYSAFQLVGLDRLSRQPHCTASILSRHDQCVGPWCLWRLSSCSACFIVKPLLLLINAENCKLSNTGTMAVMAWTFRFFCFSLYRAQGLPSDWDHTHLAAGTFTRGGEAGHRK